MNRKTLDLVAISAFAAIAMTLTLRASEGGAARTIVTLPLVLLPGYAITAAVFPGRGPGMAERLLFSLGLSLAVAVCGGLLLHWTSLGLQATSTAAVLGNTTLLASLIALARRWRRPADDPPSQGMSLSLLQGAQLAMAALLVGGALLIARDGAAAQTSSGFTQLWVLPAGPERQDSLRLGVSNHESAAQRYRLEVTTGGAVVDTWPLIALGPGQEWEAIASLPAARPGAATVEAALYRLDAPGTV
jgi:uncharacterized membrane protein